METILNLGLNDRSVIALAEASGNRRFAFDAYRRLIMMYGSTARGIDRHHFDRAFDELKRTRAARRLVRGPDQQILDTDVDADELEALVGEFKDIYRQHANEDFPQDPFVQLKGAINAVFDSWMAEKAVTYRRVEKISGLKGTAVNVCQMVFGNMGQDSGTGVCFTRDPSTGESTFYGDLLINAQGEDVVAGIRTPLPLSELQRLMPEAYDQLEAVRAMLEIHYKEMQDIEFTIEQGTLYVLQCRVGKRSPQAAFKIAVDQATHGLLAPAEARRLVKERYLPKRYLAAAIKPIITKDDAIRRIQPVDVERLFYPVLDPRIPPAELNHRRLATGIGAVPGAACGEIVFTAQEAELRGKRGANVILVRKETSPEDVGGMHAAAGILTATGGKTSHAAVVARGWGKCCIVGCDQLVIDYPARRMTLNGRTLHEGESITLDGNSGTIYDGRINLVRPDAPPEFETLMSWCDERRRLGVRTNADTPADAIRAVELGAEGIGLCRTEHMFFDPSQPRRLIAMREMILADNESDRRRALEKLLPYQREDFEGIFAAMDGKPVTVRLIDPPLHEFLPQADNREGLQSVADELTSNIRQELSKLTVWDDERRRELESKRISLADLARRIDQLHETNPMLGHRGCRLCITFPEILDMQVRAIIEAAVNVSERGAKVTPEIMIPLAIDDRELGFLIERTRAVADAILRQRGSKLKYLVGTMVETPRAALMADRLAAIADFFSFGTNDLTQMTLGLSRDDAGRFLPDYLADASSEPSTAHTAAHTAAHTEPQALARANAPADATRTSADDVPTESDLRELTEKYFPIFEDDPFQSIDVDGVGSMIYIACDGGRSTNRALKLGVCGEHGGDPKSIRFCHEVGLDYVSCSPLRVPVARLAAAQVALESKHGASPRPRGKTKPKRAASRTSSSARKRSASPKKVARKPKTRPAKSKAKSATKPQPKTGGRSKSKATKKPKSKGARRSAVRVSANTERRPKPSVAPVRPSIRSPLHEPVGV